MIFLMCVQHLLTEMLRPVHLALTVAQQTGFYYYCYYCHYYHHHHYHCHHCHFILCWLRNNFCNYGKPINGNLVKIKENLSVNLSNEKFMRKVHCQPTSWTKFNVSQPAEQNSLSANQLNKIHCQPTSWTKFTVSQPAEQTIFSHLLAMLLIILYWTESHHSKKVLSTPIRNLNVTTPCSFKDGSKISTKSLKIL